MKKNVIMCLVLVAVCFAFAGCGKKAKNPIVGKWAQGSFVYTFNEDKTCSYNAMGTLMKCTYETNGDKLSILYEGNTEPFETTFNIDKNKLNVKDSFGNDTIYEKQK